MCCINDNETKKLDLKASQEDIEKFKNKHKEFQMIFEYEKDLNDSYIIIDSKGCLATNNSHESKLSLKEYDLETLLKKLIVNVNNYSKRYKNN